MSPSIFGPDIPPAGPSTYERIFGQPCEHEIMRTGFCRSSGWATGCGSYGGVKESEGRLALIGALYHVYSKVPDRALAQRTYGMIDELWPSAPTREQIHFLTTAFYTASTVPDDPVSILVRGLPLVRSEKDWRRVLDAAAEGDGKLEMLTNLDSLIHALADPDPAVKKQGLDLLVALDDPAAWDVVASVINDPSIGEAAASSILYGKDFSHYQMALRALADPPSPEGGYSVGAKDIDLNRFAEDLSDEDLHTLLGRKEPAVDQLCLTSIRLTNRFAFLEEALAVLNDRPSAHARRAIEQLLEGPYPDLIRDEKGRSVASPWGWLMERKNERGPEPSKFRLRTEQLIYDAMQLGWSREPGTWEKWQAIYDGWMAEHAVESYSAAFAEAMYAVDPGRTITYLNATLDQADVGNWKKYPNYALVGMGAIASPEFLPAIERFVQRNDGFRNESLAYALHRCRRIQDWKLTEGSDGRSRIKRPDGSVIE